MATRSVFGRVQGLALDDQRLWVDVKGVWYVSRMGPATALIYAMAVDSKKTNTPLLLIYDDRSNTIDYIQVI